MLSINKHTGERVTGLIFNIQRFSLHDGPGIRTTVFMKGCPLRCQWCSNPESHEKYPEIVTIERNCIQCKRCVESCPKGLIDYGESVRTIKRDECDVCMACAKACPSGAIQTVGEHMDVDQVMAELKKDELFYQNSEGGITISGGEPLLQSEFVYELLKECKANDFHTALDTSGYASWDILEKILEYVDLVLYDIKMVDSEKHKELTGVSNEMILSNAKKISNIEKTIWLRYAVIPGANDSESSAKAIGKLASELKSEKISLLPYHALGVVKYERLGKVCSFKDVLPPSQEDLQRITTILKSFDADVSIGF